MGVLATIAGLVGLTAFIFSSQVTLGPTMMGFALLLAVLARIEQANTHHRQLLKDLGRLEMNKLEACHSCGCMNAPGTEKCARCRTYLRPTP